MRSTQVSVWEIQHLNTFCQYQDTVELQETHSLHNKMETSSAQGIRTMILPLVQAVHFTFKEAGGMELAITQTSMDSTMVEHIPLMLME